MSDWTLWWLGVASAGASLVAAGVLLRRLARPREFVTPSR